MRKNKGISLIVLIITIIVIIILATAILVSVINNNPISEANKARYESDRDNMQAVFTNTVGKIMAENQGVVNVTAGQINTETADVNETTGTVAYTVDNATNEANASGTIIFDKGTNDATTYYTGKKLPIYAAGETKWYVDSEGVLSLEVAGVKYGSGVIESGSDEPVTLAAGLYKTDGTFVSWEQLTSMEYCTLSYQDEDYNNVESAIINVVDGCINSCFDWGSESSVSRDYLDGKLVLSDEIQKIEVNAFYDCTLLDEVVIPNSVVEIKDNAFYDCMSIKNIILPENLTEISSSVFKNCFNLSTVSIPKNVIKIGLDAFHNTCLNTINYYGTIEEWNNIEKYVDGDFDWNELCPEITVHFTDGDIVIPANN